MIPQKTISVAPPPQQPTPDDYKNFDIVRASQYGVYERCVELIEAGYNVNQPDAENVSILHWAAINNRTDIVKSVFVDRRQIHIRLFLSGVGVMMVTL